MAEESKLPSAMQAKKERLENTAVPPQDVPATDASATDASAQVEQSADTGGDRVTLSKEEFNALQAKAERVKAAEGRLQAVMGDVEAMQHRLTELEEAAKSSGKGAVSGPSSAAPTPSEFVERPLSEQQREDFEAETVAMVEQVAGNVFAKNIATIVARLDKLENSISSTSEQVQTAVVDNFTAGVRAEVAKLVSPEDTAMFDTIVRNQHWTEFLDSEANDLGDTFADILRRAIDGKKTTAAVNVFSKFHDKYLKQTAPKPDGYAGAVPSGNSVPSTNESSGKEVLNFSERQAAHKRYLNGEINYEEFNKIKEKFDIADREGRVNYEK